MTGCIHEDHDTLNPTTPPSVETPKLPANPSIPADAPTVPNKPAPNTAFKVSIDLVAASKTASSPLLVGDDASVAIAAQTARSEVKELKVKLKAEDFTRAMPSSKLMVWPKVLTP
ncbi:hypothetical protein JCM19237_1817 [Photobacterium aphoticum]|uniref:Uncharacterized protein n=1 Tax=Photobacterium aphoticum TaxID=754436 RepID=A0A090RF31_9GAMM|nr:hypothetical protein JCM19237_1817 [Photobacterium aphoticum]